MGQSNKPTQIQRANTAVSPPVAFPEVIAYAAKDTEHAHQSALFMWIALARLAASKLARNEPWTAKGKPPATLLPDHDGRPLMAYFRAGPDWLAFKADDLARLDLLFAIPNGGARDGAAASRLVAEGVKTGVPDLCLPVASHIEGRGTCHGLFIEMKRPASRPKTEQGTLKRAKGQVKDNQQAFMERLEGEGYATTVCYTYLEALAALWRYFEGEVP